jgi:hypothetical protein
MGMSPESPAAVWSFGEQDPRALLELRTICGLGDDAGELLDDASCLARSRAPWFVSTWTRT